MYTRENTISTASAAATQPSRRFTRNSPAVTAPAITAWSLGNAGSVVGVASTRMPGNAAYGRDSLTQAAIGWLTATANSVPNGAHTAAATLVGSPVPAGDPPAHDQQAGEQHQPVAG